MALTGKTIGDLIQLTEITPTTLFLVEDSGLTRNISYSAFSDTYVTGFTYNDSNIITLSLNNNQNFNLTLNQFTGLTINGDLFSNKISVVGEGINISGKTTTTNLQITSGATDGYVLTSDVDGNATWQSPSGGGGFTYEIGQYVSDEGGVIFHRWMDGSTQKYLVVDMVDLSNNAIWATDLQSIVCVSNWNGSGNTANMESGSPTNGITTGTAAELCFNSNNGGKSDWYLPAIYELQKLNDNRLDVSITLENNFGTDLSVGNYWSSTEYSLNNTLAYVWRYLPNTSYGLGTAAKLTGISGQSCGVRAIRQFNI